MHAYAIRVYLRSYNSGVTKPGPTRAYPGLGPGSTTEI